MLPRNHQDSAIPRRDFLKHSVVTAGMLGATHAAGGEEAAAQQPAVSGGGVTGPAEQAVAQYNTVYTGERLSRIAFPLGGIGAGMVCLEGAGALSHVSLRHKPDMFNEPFVFAGLCLKGKPNVARVLEGPVPAWKRFGMPGSGNGLGQRTYGLPRFAEASFLAHFPFATVKLTDPKVPLAVELTAWSPFEPGDPDSASLPVAGMEYRFTNTSSETADCVFSFNAANFMEIGGPGGRGVKDAPHGFMLFKEGTPEEPWRAGAFVASVTDPAVKVNRAWFRGGWWDPFTMTWKDVSTGACYDRPAIAEGDPAPGASLFVPFKLEAGKSKTITVQLAWYVGQSNLRIGQDQPDATPGKYAAWYTGRFADVSAVADHWRSSYDKLREASARFCDCFYDSTLPPEVLEAVAANLTILKSPTVLRQADGRLWAFEGCHDDTGCCHGSCTHVWNYAQAIPHLFPQLERTLRETEFKVSQADTGHQAFRTSLPIRPTVHDFHAAADGQLGGIMKVHREWRISGDTEWLRRLWPKVRASLDYCITTWDPQRKGILEEPHHNTYDIEFWGPDGMCTSFYLGALSAAVKMGTALDDDVAGYRELLAKGSAYVEKELYDGEYFIQKVQWEGLKAKSPLETGSAGNHPPEALELLRAEGPKYQYGSGCLSDGVLGCWMALVCGVGRILDPRKVASHLAAVHRYNLRRDLSEHANPQRPTFAFGNEGGLLLCSWPKGGELSLPFVYSNEVWTGIEYQVAAHLMLMGMPEQGLEIARVARDRYDGRCRNPFNEYECGHWYARAMSSYAMLQGLSGARYDAVDKTLYLEPAVVGDFRSFLATATGYGTVGVRQGQPFIETKSGQIEVKNIRYTPKA